MFKIKKGCTCLCAEQRCLGNDNRCCLGPALGQKQCVNAGLGFADCSAMLRDVPAAELGRGISYVREHEALPAQARFLRES